MPLSSLFRPFQVKTLNLPNRIVMAPMTRSFSPGGIPTEEVAQYYQRRAGAAVGLIISEGTVINRPSASNDPNVPRFWGAALPAWKQVIDGVHAAGGVMAPQLWHVGAVRNPRTDWAVPEPIDSPFGAGSARQALWRSHERWFNSRHHRGLCACCRGRQGAGL